MHPYLFTSFTGVQGGSAPYRWTPWALGFGFGTAVGIRTASLPFLLSGHNHEIFIYGPWVAVAAGVVAWLAPHFRPHEQSVMNGEANGQEPSG